MSSSSEWVHCNKCYRTPSSTPGSVFYFSSCGHLLCKKCISSPDGRSMSTVCAACSKNASFLEINRSLRPDIANFFRNPSELATQYMTQLKKVLEFQSANRTRLMKYTNEKSKKTQKFAEMAQVELKKRVELERKAVEERDKLEAEAERCRQQYEQIRLKCATLETRLEARGQEIAQLRSMRGTTCFTVPRTRGGTDSGFASASSDISFHEFLTSTPKQGPSPVDRARSSAERVSSKEAPADFFGNNAHLSPIVPGSDPLSTPAMLGLKKKAHRRSASSSRPGEQNLLDYASNIMDYDVQSF